MTTHGAQSRARCADLDVGVAWQDVTVRLIAQRGVFHGNAPRSTRKRWTLRGMFAARAAPKRRMSLGTAIAVSSELFIQDEVARCKISLPPPLIGRKYHLFCSASNAGALEVAEELKESDVWMTKGRSASATLAFTTDVDKMPQCDHSTPKAGQRTYSLQPAPARHYLAAARPCASLLTHVATPGRQCSFCSTRARGRAVSTRASSSSTSTRRCARACTSSACTSFRLS
jgi:hypothetical protein